MFVTNMQSQSSHRNLRDKEVEELPSTQTNKEDKENYFVLERGFDYYPDNYYPNARKPYYGASNFPDQSPQDGYYPLCNPRMYSRDPRFDDPYYRRKFRNV